MGLGQNIKALRKKEGLTQEQLAKRIGLSTIAIRQYENGLRKPKYKIVESIAKALQCDISELVSPKEEGELIIQNLIDTIEDTHNENEKAQQAAEAAVEGDYLVYLANFLIQNSEEISLLRKKGYRIEITSKRGAIIQIGFVKTFMTTSALVKEISEFGKTINLGTEDDDNAPQT